MQQYLTGLSTQKNSQGIVLGYAYETPTVLLPFCPEWMHLHCHGERSGDPDAIVVEIETDGYDRFVCMGSRNVQIGGRLFDFTHSLAFDSSGEQDPRARRDNRRLAAEMLAYPGFLTTRGFDDAQARYLSVAMGAKWVAPGSIAIERMPALPPISDRALGSLAVRVWEAWWSRIAQPSCPKQVSLYISRTIKPNQLREEAAAFLLDILLPRLPESVWSMLSVSCGYSSPDQRQETNCALTILRNGERRVATAISLLEPGMQIACPEQYEPLADLLAGHGVFALYGALCALTDSVAVQADFELAWCLAYLEAVLFRGVDSAYAEPQAIQDKIEKRLLDHGMPRGDIRALLCPAEIKMLEMERREGKRYSAAQYKKRYLRYLDTDAIREGIMPGAETKAPPGGAPICAGDPGFSGAKDALMSAYFSVLTNPRALPEGGESLLAIFQECPGPLSEALIAWLLEDRLAQNALLSDDEILLLIHAAEHYGEEPLFAPPLAAHCVAWMLHYGNAPIVADLAAAFRLEAHVETEWMRWLAAQSMETLAAGEKLFLTARSYISPEPEADERMAASLRRICSRHRGKITIAHLEGFLSACAALSLHTREAAVLFSELWERAGIAPPLHTVMRMIRFYLECGEPESARSFLMEQALAHPGDLFYLQQYLELADELHRGAEQLADDLFTLLTKCYAEEALEMGLAQRAFRRLRSAPGGISRIYDYLQAHRQGHDHPQISRQMEAAIKAQKSRVVAHDTLSPWPKWKVWVLERERAEALSFIRGLDSFDELIRLPGAGKTVLPWLREDTQRRWEEVILEDAPTRLAVSAHCAEICRKWDVGAYQSVFEKLDELRAHSPSAYVEHLYASLCEALAGHYESLLRRSNIPDMRRLLPLLERREMMPSGTTALLGWCLSFSDCFERWLPEPAVAPPDLDTIRREMVALIDALDSGFLALASMNNPAIRDRIRQALWRALAKKRRRFSIPRCAAYITLHALHGNPPDTRVDWVGFLLSCLSIHEDERDLLTYRPKKYEQICALLTWLDQAEGKLDASELLIYLHPLAMTRNLRGSARLRKEYRALYSAIPLSRRINAKKLEELSEEKGWIVRWLFSREGE